MRIQLASDIHLEFALEEYWAGVKDYIDKLILSIKTNVDILCLAGDISTLHHPYEPRNIRTSDMLSYFFERLTNEYEDVVMVPGNHEFYHSNFEYSRKVLSKYGSMFYNLHFLDNSLKVFNGWRVVGGTLWFSDTPEVYNHSWELNDFFEIDAEIKDIIKEGEKTIKFLEENVDDKTIVLTHHAPLYTSVSRGFESNRLNCYYVHNSAASIIDRCSPILWMHGHMHASSDYRVGDTRVVCNPHGYIFRQNKNFIKNLIIKL